MTHAAKSTSITKTQEKREEGEEIKNKKERDLKPKRNQQKPNNFHLQTYRKAWSMSILLK